MARKGTRTSDPAPRADKPVVFLSYAHADAAWKDRLLRQLGSLEHRALLTIWQDGKIAGGDDWHGDITAAMDAASLAIFLVSPAFLGSTFIQETEVPYLFARWEKRAEGLRIYPILAEPCDWESASYLKRLQIRPKSKRTKPWTKNSSFGRTSSRYAACKSRGSAYCHSPTTPASAKRGERLAAQSSLS